MKSTQLTRIINQIQRCRNKGIAAFRAKVSEFFQNFKLKRERKYENDTYSNKLRRHWGYSNQTDK